MHDYPQTNPWKTHSSETKYNNPWIHVVEHQVTNPAGGDGIYGVVQFKNIAVAVVPVDNEGFTWLVGQFRYCHDSYEWEIPEGGCPKDEDPAACAQRELKEETGLTADRLQAFLEMQLSNSTTNEISISYLATEITEGQSCPEPTEQLAVRRLPLDEAFAMVHRNEIRDALSIATLLRLETALLKGELKLKCDTP